MKLKQNSFETVSKLFCVSQNSRETFLSNHSRYPLFVRNCYQSNCSQQTRRSHAL